MVIPGTETPRAENCIRLDEVLTGERAMITRAESHIIERRLMLIDLALGNEIEIENRDQNGDLVVINSGRRFHVQEHYAKQIWVEPVAFAG